MRRDYPHLGSLGCLVAGYDIFSPNYYRHMDYQFWMPKAVDWPIISKASKIIDHPIMV